MGFLLIYVFLIDRLFSPNPDTVSVSMESVGLSEPLEQWDPVRFRIPRPEETLEPPVRELEVVEARESPPTIGGSSSVSSCTVEVGGEQGGC